MEIKNVVSKAAPEKAHLKAERVQGSAGRSRLKAERVQEALKHLPGWALGADGNEIVRTRLFGDPEEARAYVNHVCRLASMRHHAVKIGFSGAQVVVTLKGKAVFGAGLTPSVFNLADTIG